MSHIDTLKSDIKTIAEKKESRLSQAEAKQLHDDLKAIITGNARKSWIDLRHDVNAQILQEQLANQLPSNANINLTDDEWQYGAYGQKTLRALEMVMQTPAEATTPVQPNANTQSAKVTAPSTPTKTTKKTDNNAPKVIKGDKEAYERYQLPLVVNNPEAYNKVSGEFGDWLQNKQTTADDLEALLTAIYKNKTGWKSETGNHEIDNKNVDIARVIDKFNDAHSENPIDYQNGIERLFSGTDKNEQLNVFAGAVWERYNQLVDKTENMRANFLLFLSNYTTDGVVIDSKVQNAAVNEKTLYNELLALNDTQFNALAKRLGANGTMQDLLTKPQTNKEVLQFKKDFQKGIDQLIGTKKLSLAVILQNKTKEQFDAMYANEQSVKQQFNAAFGDWKNSEEGRAKNGELEAFLKTHPADGVTEESVWQQIRISGYQALLWAYNGIGATADLWDTVRKTTDGILSSVTFGITNAGIGIFISTKEYKLDSAGKFGASAGIGTLAFIPFVSATGTAVIWDKNPSEVPRQLQGETLKNSLRLSATVGGGLGLILGNVNIGRNIQKDIIREGDKMDTLLQNMQTYAPNNAENRQKFITKYKQNSAMEQSLGLFYDKFFAKAEDMGYTNANNNQQKNTAILTALKQGITTQTVNDLYANEKGWHFDGAGFGFVDVLNTALFAIPSVNFSNISQSWEKDTSTDAQMRKSTEKAILETAVDLNQIVTEVNGNLRVEKFIQIPSNGGVNEYVEITKVVKDGVTLSADDTFMVQSDAFIINNTKKSTVQTMLDIDRDNATATLFVTTANNTASVTQTEKVANKIDLSLIDTENIKNARALFSTPNFNTNLLTKNTARKLQNTLVNNPQYDSNEGELKNLWQEFITFAKTYNKKDTFNNVSDAEKVVILHMCSSAFMYSPEMHNKNSNTLLKTKDKKRWSAFTDRFMEKLATDNNAADKANLKNMIGKAQKAYAQNMQWIKYIQNAPVSPKETNLASVAVAVSEPARNKGQLPIHGLGYGNVPQVVNNGENTYMNISEITGWNDGIPFLRNMLVDSLPASTIDNIAKISGVDTIQVVKALKTDGKLSDTMNVNFDMVYFKWWTCYNDAIGIRNITVNGQKVETTANVGILSKMTAHEGANNANNTQATVGLYGDTDIESTRPSESGGGGGNIWNNGSSAPGSSPD